MAKGLVEAKDDYGIDESDMTIIMMALMVLVLAQVVAALQEVT